MGVVSAVFGERLDAAQDLDPACGISSQEKQLVAPYVLKQLACNLLGETLSIQPFFLVDFEMLHHTGLATEIVQNQPEFRRDIE
jgi:hypothetical protein